MKTRSMISFDWAMKRIDHRLLSDSSISTALLEGRIEGEAIGLEKGEAIGLEKGLEKVAINSHLAGYSLEAISNITGLTPEQIAEILKRQGLA